jgi:hypothetical protein
MGAHTRGIHCYCDASGSWPTSLPFYESSPLSRARRLGARRWRACGPSVALGAGVVLCATLAGCDRKVSTPADSKRELVTVGRAACAPHDHPESGLQGQVPAPLRKVGGFAGFNCNLELVGQSRGDGAGWQNVFYSDRSGHVCSYYDTSPIATGRTHTGVVVVDATDANHPVPTAYLASPAMVDPLESLKVNARRQLLAAVDSITGTGGPMIELYDISADCRFPRLLSPTRPQGSAAPQDPVRGDEGSFSPDGLTYYATNLRGGLIYPIDVSDPQRPRVLAEWSMPFNQRTSGLSTSEDGNRAYLTLFGHGSAAPARGRPSLDNGVIIADVSDVQARRVNPQIKVISTLLWGDGSASHQTIPLRIDGKAYLIATDQGGSGVANGDGWTAACRAGLPAWSMARIIDIEDERNPTIAAKLALEVNDPKNCGEVLPDLTGLSGFTYDNHYCSVDNQQNATTLACASFESGVRVFDIRNPSHPKEIAYFVPPSVTTPGPGSWNNRAAATGRPDHCSAQIRLDAATSTLMTTCQDNGFLALKFASGVWPFSSARSPAAQ